MPAPFCSLTVMIKIALLNNWLDLGAKVKEKQMTNSLRYITHGIKVSTLVFGRYMRVTWELWEHGFLGLIPGKFNLIDLGWQPRLCSFAKSPLSVHTNWELLLEYAELLILLWLGQNPASYCHDQKGHVKKKRWCHWSSLQTRTVATCRCWCEWRVFGHVRPSRAPEVCV